MKHSRKIFALMLAISMVCTSIPSLATENTADTSVSADDTVKEITQNESDIQDTDIVFDEYSNTDTENPVPTEESYDEYTYDSDEDVSLYSTVTGFETDPATRANLPQTKTVTSQAHTVTEYILTHSIQNKYWRVKNIPQATNTCTIRIG